MDFHSSIYHSQNEGLGAQFDVIAKCFDGLGKEFTNKKGAETGNREKTASLKAHNPVAHEMRLANDKSPSLPFLYPSFHTNLIYLRIEL